MSSDIKTKTGVRVVTAVDDRELIQVKTIKAKFLEQMPTLGVQELKNLPSDEIHVVGATKAWIVFQGKGDLLRKAHRTHWHQYLMAGADWSEENLHVAATQINNYTQLFED